MTERKPRRNKDEWKNMTVHELTSRVASRYARIEMLKLEIRQLQDLIEKKS